MRLIDPGVGEVTDRLTILALKVLYGAEAGKDIAHFQREQSALLAKVRTKDLNGAWFHHTLELSALNAALWQAEDALRDLRPKPKPLPPWDPVKAAADLAFRIQALNDRRAELVALINKAAGDVVTEEKVR